MVSPMAMTFLIGLSPRVRGNRMGAFYQRVINRSTPRVRGNPLLQSGHLSPRVRGNLARGKAANLRSIPASAGEPGQPHGLEWTTAVYPRECGGTGAGRAHWMPTGGLSPRVRGNLCGLPSRLPARRSIPASAGEPTRPPSIQSSAAVYPRECGGTMSAGRPRYLP